MLWMLTVKSKRIQNARNTRLWRAELWIKWGWEKVATRKNILPWTNAIKYIQNVVSAMYEFLGSESSTLLYAISTTGMCLQCGPAENGMDLRYFHSLSLARTWTHTRTHTEHTISVPFFFLSISATDIAMAIETNEIKDKYTDAENERERERGREMVRNREAFT